MNSLDKAVESCEQQQKRWQASLTLAFRTVVDRCKSHIAATPGGIEDLSFKPTFDGAIDVSFIVNSSDHVRVVEHLENLFADAPDWCLEALFQLQGGMDAKLVHTCNLMPVSNSEKTAWLARLQPFANDDSKKIAAIVAGEFPR